jgi:PhoPQ-activated pathogenicity-related protein
MKADGSIAVQAQDRPAEVNLWQATNPKARDFRLETLGPVYQKSRLEAQKDGSYLASVPKPASGWTAFFVELVYDNGTRTPFKFTTQVSIVPDVLPFSIEDYKKTLKKR